MPRVTPAGLQELMCRRSNRPTRTSPEISPTQIFVLKASAGSRADWSGLISTYALRFGIRLVASANTTAEAAPSRPRHSHHRIRFMDALPQLEDGKPPRGHARALKLPHQGIAAGLWLSR